MFDVALIPAICSLPALDVTLVGLDPRAGYHVAGGGRAPLDTRIAPRSLLQILILIYVVVPGRFVPVVTVTTRWTPPRLHLRPRCWRLRSLADSRWMIIDRYVGWLPPPRRSHVCRFGPYLHVGANHTFTFVPAFEFVRLLVCSYVPRHPTLTYSPYVVGITRLLIDSHG